MTSIGDVQINDSVTRAHMRQQTVRALAHRLNVLCHSGSAMKAKITSHRLRQRWGAVDPSPARPPAAHLIGSKPVTGSPGDLRGKIPAYRFGPLRQDR